MRVRICNSDPEEARQLAEALAPVHQVEVQTVCERTKPDLSGVDALVLDTNFTENHGFELLMDGGAGSRVPVLLVAPPDDPQLAIEARRLGVFNYVVKTPKLAGILRLAVDETANLFADASEQRRLLQTLRLRVSDLEARVREAQGDPATPAAPDAAGPARRRKLFETLLERVGKGELQVPNMPEVPAKLRELLRTDPDIVEVAKLLRQDASLCARVIGVANSAYYGSFKTSHTIEQAVSTLGLNATWRHVELAANRNLYTLGDNRYRALLKPLWVHAAACAELCRAIALETRLVEPDVAFTMGLLHDIGHLFLIQLVAEADAGGGIEAPPGEQAMARFLAEYHGPFGARILELWKLPPEYATVARRHEQPTADGDGAAAARVVHLADLMSARIGFGDRDKAPLEAELDALAASLALPPEKLRDMERDVAKLLGEI